MHATSISASTQRSSANISGFDPAFQLCSSDVCKGTLHVEEDAGALSLLTHS